MPGPNTPYRCECRCNLCEGRIRGNVKPLLLQIEDVGAGAVSLQWVETRTLPEILDELARKAFIENWPRDSFKARVVLKGLELLRRPGKCYIGIDEPGVHET